MKRALILVLATQLVLGIVYSFATPIFEPSDEIWHYPVVREIATNLRLPVQDPAVETRWAQEGSQPPLYYAIAAALTGWIDTTDYEANALLNPFVKIGVTLAGDNHNQVAHPPGQSPLQGGTVLAVYLIRWLSLLFGVATAYLAYRLARAIVPGRPPLALLAAAFVAFNPMVLFINASVNNDNLLMMLSALALWLLVRDLDTAEAGPRWRSTLLLGLVIGLAAITKVSGLVLLPVAALGFTLVAWRQRDWRAWLVRGLVLGLVVAAVAGWWYLRNYGLYGELTGTQRMVEVAGPRPAGFRPADLLEEWRSFWYSFWGVFGAFNILAPPWFYALVSALSLLAGAGLAVSLVRTVARRQAPPRWRAHLLLLAFIGLTFAGVVRWTLLTVASQGRLMFGAIAPLAFYLALGILAWFPLRWQPNTARLLAAGLAVVAAFLPLAVIRPAYQPPAPIQAMPPDAVVLNVRCGDAITLAGYRPAHTRVEAGQPLDVTLYWSATQPITRPLQLSLNGYGFKGENFAKLDTWPGGGTLPTTFWQPGALYADRYLLQTDSGSNTPTTTKLGISWSTDLLDPATNEAVLCYVDGQASDGVFVDAGSLVGPGPAENPASAAPVSSLQHGIQLLAAEVLASSRPLPVTLTWAATEPIPGDYTVFVHLFDAAGNKVAQADAPPRDGFWPTSLWRPGEPVTSSHSLELPPDLPAGQYTLGAGMYDPTTGQRLFAYDAQGNEWRDWMIVLSPVNFP